MAGLEPEPPADWGTTVAKWTYIFTLVLAVLYIGSVFLFILPH